MTDPTIQFAEEFEIRRLLENWVIWRDSGDFERFATLWHPSGRMVATWCQASASAFIAMSQKSFEQGTKALHTLGGSHIEVSKRRAISQTKTEIRVRGHVHDVEVDVVCQGRFFDFLEKIDGRWLLYLRQPIYELDQMIPIEPGRRIELDLNLLNCFPEGYRHMAYMQTQLGIDVKRDLPGTHSLELQALTARGRAWLAGEPVAE